MNRLTTPQKEIGCTGLEHYRLAESPPIPLLLPLASCLVSTSNLNYEQLMSSLITDYCSLITAVMSYFDPVTSVYIHIPFCRRRCFYCDFPIFVLGNRTNPATFPPVVEYVEILQEEISLSQGTGKPLETIFFGGGLLPCYRGHPS